MRIRLVLTVMEKIFLALHPSIQRTSMSTSYYFLHCRATASCNLHRPSPLTHNWKAPWLPVCLFIYQGSGNCTPGKFNNCILFCVIFMCWCVCVCAPQHMSCGARVDIRGQLFESVHSFLPFLYVCLELNSSCHVHTVPLSTKPSCLPW